MSRNGKKAKKIIIFLLICLLCLGSIPNFSVSARADTSQGEVVLSVERFTIGKGWLTEPDIVPLQSGDTVATLIERYLGDKGYTCMGRDSSMGYYLEGIRNADTNEIPLNIPNAVLDIAKADEVTLSNQLKNERMPDLYEFSYYNTSGWMYAVNDVYPNYSMGKYEVQDGDVIQVQFTLYGTGADVEGGNYYARADQRKLLKRLAQINQDKDAWLYTEEYQQAYDNAVAQLQKLKASQAQINNALSALPKNPAVLPEQVVLSSNSLTLYENDEAQTLKAQVLPQNATYTGITWSSSDESVVTVEQNGTIKPAGVGEADISAETFGGVKDVCHVTVIEKPFTSITLNVASVSLSAGGTYQLEVTGTEPEDATEALEITWESSAPDVASVDENGLVTGGGNGTAVITARTKSGVSASCRITVDSDEQLAVQAEEMLLALPNAGDIERADIEVVYQVRDFYNSLSEVVKEKISDRETLEKKLSACIKMADTLYNQYKRVQHAEELIKKIPSLSELSLKDQVTVAEAEAAFNDLTQAEKAQLDSTLQSRLKSAVKRIEELQQSVDEVNTMLRSIPGTIDWENLEQVAETYSAYQELNEEQRAAVSAEAYQNLLNAVSQINEMVVHAIENVNTDKSVNLEYQEVQEFIRAECAVQDLQEVLELSAETVKKQAEAQEWLSEGIHEDGTVVSDGYWYVQLNAKEEKDISDAWKLIRKKYSTAEKPDKAWNLSYVDIRDGSSYQQEKSINLTFGVPDLSSMENPVLFLYDGEKIKKLNPTVDKKAGTITVKTRTDGMYLVADMPIALKSIALPESANLQTGNTLNLKPEKIPETASGKYEYVWKSSDSSIVKVSSDGVATGVKEGSATITCTLKSNSKIKASCKITVVTKANALSKSTKDIISETKAYMLSLDQNPAKGSEWFVLGFARSGMDLNDAYFQTYYNHMANYIKEKDGKIASNENYYTDYSKMILVMTAIGKDARDIAGYNLLSNLADFNKVKKQGLNGPVWALIALKSNPEYKIPEVAGVSDQTTEQKLIDYLVDRELEGGGWALSGQKADSDITAMTMQALAPYYKKEGYEKVTAALDRALDKLSSIQFDTGGFGTINGNDFLETSESVSQVLTAVTALGIDPQTDYRFIKNGKWMVENLASYHIDGSGFMHVKAGADNNGGGEAGKVNGMATEQGFYAMVAYQRLLDGKTSLYDMSDLTVKSGEEGDGSGTGIEENDKTGTDETSGTNSNNNSSNGSGSGTTANTSSNTSSKTTGTTAGTTTAKTTGKTTGKTAASSSANKKTAEKEDKEDAWSFDGETYTAKAEEPDVDTTDSEDTADTAVQKENAAENAGFGKEAIPYVLCVLCGIAVVGVCVYFKKKG